ncbi:uncharacterized protein BXZ73DRAFT_103506 [Epithele typhae]|uniref:uncharacterized protein n=1 Tax=Epithele typhae TaxID=378194 RepID=UPI002008CAC4|nr:uncharacterized protein BXZ73DRAFT_103506 [Epithele typhae]KAH9924666.1 hypothetical protein BXZ73DRAFT_103506 [Epithele typhae]
MRRLVPGNGTGKVWSLNTWKALYKRLPYITLWAECPDIMIAHYVDATYPETPQLVLAGSDAER